MEPHAVPHAAVAPCGRPRARRPLAVWLAGRIDFDRYADMAERLAWEVSEPDGRGPTLVLCEPAPAITIGRGGSRADVGLTDDDLRSHGLAVRFVGRGGGAVPHGPGQAFAALFARLEDLGLDRHDVGGYLERFHCGLEKALRDLRTGAVRRPGHAGVFGRTGLLAAVGVAVRRGVACHGAFVNISPPLDLCQRVRSAAVPGAAGCMGSVEADLQRRVRMQDARTALAQRITDAFVFPRSFVHAGFPLAVRAPHREGREAVTRA